MSPFRCCDPPTSPPRRAVAFSSLYHEGLEGLVVGARKGLQGTQSCYDCLEVGCPGLPQDCGVFQLPGDALRGTQSTDPGLGRSGSTLISKSPISRAQQAHRDEEIALMPPQARGPRQEVSLRAEGAPPTLSAQHPGPLGPPRCSPAKWRPSLK